MNSKVSSRLIAYAVIQVFLFMVKQWSFVNGTCLASFQLVGHHFLVPSPCRIRFPCLLLLHHWFLWCPQWSKCEGTCLSPLGVVEYVHLFPSHLMSNPDSRFFREVFPNSGAHVHPSKSTSYRALEAQRAAREGWGVLYHVYDMSALLQYILFYLLSISSCRQLSIPVCEILERKRHDFGQVLPLKKIPWNWNFTRSSHECWNEVPTLWHLTRHSKHYTEW